MRASVILYSIAASSLIEANALRQRTGGSHAAKIAGIVPTHKTTFKFFKQFARDWEACPEGREAMDLMPVFSTEEDHEQFNMKLKTQFPDFKFDDHVFTPLIAQRLPKGAKPGAWKKFEGLAQVLSNMDGYEFALMFDQKSSSIRARVLERYWKNCAKGTPQECGMGTRQAFLTAMARLWNAQRRR
mmetsp:Transcript_78412/g.210457  ORF Transcript_78412/g.210457 Transcript_78412/m.210457 type:complete len:186 (+) Transcript_78412:16-573(+)